MKKYLTIHLLLVLVYISYVEWIVYDCFENSLSIGLLVLLLLCLHGFIFGWLHRKFHWKWIVVGIIVLFLFGIGFAVLLEHLLVQHRYNV